jgi:hypothetical protein
LRFFIGRPACVRPADLADPAMLREAEPGLTDPWIEAEVADQLLRAG